MKAKIKEHYETKFSSSECLLEITDEEIEFIIKHDCKCSTCGKSIFEMWDFPELMINDDELRCEDCYDEDFRALCPICENSYDTYDGVSDHEVIIEDDEDYNFESPGIYKNGQLIVPIRINDFKRIELENHSSYVYSDKICPECVQKFTTKENFLLIDYGIPCLLIEKHRHDTFSDWTIERIKRHRKALIHQRITCRGIIQKANKKQ